MTYGFSTIVAQIGRLGREAEVLIRGETGQNEFGNVTDDYTLDRTVLAYKTYPNRNTQVENSVGDRSQDRPVFIVPKGRDQPKPPEEEDLIRFDGVDYEVKSHTEYDTHVEFFGGKLIHDDNNL